MSILPQDMPANKADWLALIEEIDGHFADIESAWVDYAPTVTAGSGAFTTLGAVAAKYKAIGKIVFVVVDIAITTNGTAAVYVQFTLPVDVVGTGDVGAGREVNVSGNMLQLLGSGSIAQIFNYDNTYPGGDGYRLIGNIAYEQA